MVLRLSAIVVIVAGLVACTVTTPATTPVRSTNTPVAPTPSPAGPALAGSAPPAPSPSVPPAATRSTATSPPQATPTGRPAATPTELPGRLSAWQIVPNGDFDSGINPWRASYGRLKTTTGMVHSGTGAAQLTTGDADPGGGYRGTFGQCLDASSRIGEWPQVNGQKHVTFEAFVKTGADITGASLVAIFFENAKCSGEQLSPAGTTAVGENQDWTRVSVTTAMPERVQSIHVYVWATGRTSTAIVHVDDIQAWAADPSVAP